MARTSVATDNFNRTGPGLGANWAQLTPTGAGNVQITAGNVAFAGSVFGADAVARWVGAGSFADDQYSSVVISSGYTGTPNYGIGVVARASSGTDAGSGATREDFYFAHISSTTTLGKMVDGVPTVLAASASPTWAAGDRLEIECDGTTIRLCKTGTPLGSAGFTFTTGTSFTVTDSSLSTGLPGILAKGDPGVITGDDWEGGDIVAGPAFTPAVICSLGL